MIHGPLREENLHVIMPSVGLRQYHERTAFRLLHERNVSRIVTLGLGRHDGINPIVDTAVTGYPVPCFTTVRNSACRSAASPLV